MPESSEFERRNDRLRDIEIITNRQADWLTDKLSPNPSEAELFMDGLRVELVQDKHLYCIFPARLKSNAAGTKHTFFFDNPTAQNLVERFSEPYQLTESEVSELYIGTGIAANLLKMSIREQNRKKVERVLNILTNPQEITTAIRCTGTLNENYRENIIQSLLQSDESRIGNINMLRFAFGMVYAQADEVTEESGEQAVAVPRETRVMQQFRKGLILTLNNRPQYRQLGRIVFPGNESGGLSEGDLVGEKVFADAVGEFELAACFPMQLSELRTILSIVKK